MMIKKNKKYTETCLLSSLPHRAYTLPVYISYMNSITFISLCALSALCVCASQSYQLPFVRTRWLECRSVREHTPKPCGESEKEQLENERKNSSFFVVGNSFVVFVNLHSRPKKISISHLIIIVSSLAHLQLWILADIGKVVFPFSLFFLSVSVLSVNWNFLFLYFYFFSFCFFETIRNHQASNQFISHTILFYFNIIIICRFSFTVPLCRERKK